jgi:hypothetical protein
MTDQEIINAYYSQTRLQVEADGAWINCIITSPTYDLEGVSEVRLMILDPEGWPTDFPAQDFSRKNFGRLRVKA